MSPEFPEPEWSFLGDVCERWGIPTITVLQYAAEGIVQLDCFWAPNPDAFPVQYDKLMHGSQFGDIWDDTVEPRMVEPI